MSYPLEGNIPMTLKVILYFKPSNVILPARRYAWCAVLAVIACPSVRLSVRRKPALYQNGYTVGSRKQRCTIAQGLCSYMMQKLSTKFW